MLGRQGTYFDSVIRLRSGHYTLIWWLKLPMSDVHLTNSKVDDLISVAVKVFVDALVGSYEGSLIFARSLS